MKVVGGQTASHVRRLLLSVTTVTQAWDLMSLSEVSLYEMWSAVYAVCQPVLYRNLLNIGS